MTEAGDAHDTDPTMRVEAVFRRIHAERMAGLPICNPALRVAAIDFRRWQGDWVGALVLPWAINLLIVPGSGAFRAVSVGQGQTWVFPSGAYDFMGSREAGLGAYQSCSLFSPVSEFASQADAEAVAQAAMAGLLSAPPEARPAPLDRRAFLRTALGRHA
ncbi:[NiFe]-hydrogenase assembly chaperone HybE [Denitromonas iodatirespirans]|uniref:[NiFe]-hydrogenase assembly chaperone HybE n=1 Tax=Denitromonas iodatirespirans TaxID=2795389 RepID=A0A944D7L2_DENI1|nr:[NiFe]-hydrogenase assembly chaperone HybE [Denitromonas iodatirespirans]MBT0959781.1 [NiFe]-hydrogenase assembly chaperone HybE [Denitromonas iodatirespirans]